MTTLKLGFYRYPGQFCELFLMPILPQQTSGDPSTLRWRSVVTRDASDNSFVYAVRSTGIYCRPRCPARLARRANVEYFDSPSQAEAAGYRPCKRCRPNLADVGENEKQLVQGACNTIIQLILEGEKPDLHQLAANAHLSYSHFHRTFKKIVGVTLGEYVKITEQRTHSSSGQSHTDGSNTESSVQALTGDRDFERVELPLPDFDPLEREEYVDPIDCFIDWNAFDNMITD